MVRMWPQPLYLLLEAAFQASQTAAGWLFAVYLYAVKPVLHLFCADLLNRCVRVPHPPALP
jgi:hypothetical protein